MASPKALKNAVLSAPYIFSVLVAGYAFTNRGRVDTRAATRNMDTKSRAAAATSSVHGSSSGGNAEHAHAHALGHVGLKGMIQREIDWQET